MGPLGDIQEAKSFFPKASLITKLIVILATFLSISSIASLSNVIFSWKGFILDGINFYKHWVTDPLKEFAFNFDVFLNNENIDTLMLCLLMISGVLRETVAKRPWIESFFGIVLFSCVIFSAITNVDANYEANLWSISILIFMFILMPFFLGFDSESKIIYFSPIIIGIFAVLVLGAINTGLTRTV